MKTLLGLLLVLYGLCSGAQEFSSTYNRNTVNPGMASGGSNFQKVIQHNTAEPDVKSGTFKLVPNDIGQETLNFNNDSRIVEPVAKSFAPVGNELKVKPLGSETSGNQGVKSLVRNEFYNKQSLSLQSKLDVTLTDQTFKEYPNQFHVKVPNTCNDQTGSTNLQDAPSIILDPPDQLIQYTDIYQGYGPPQSFTVSCSNLTSDLILTCFSDFGMSDISLNHDDGYTTSLTLTPVSGYIEETIWVRNYSWDSNWLFIELSSSGIYTSYYVETDMLPGNAPATTIANVTAEPGNTVVVPVTIKDFDNISFANYYIDYNPNVLTFINTIPDFVGIGMGDYYINENVRRLSIALGSTSDFCWSVPDNDTLFSLVFFYVGGSSDLTFVELPSNSFQKCYYILPNEEPFEDFHHNGSVSEVIKDVNLKLYLESLYNPETGRMNKVQGADGDRFGGDTTDMVTVNLALTEYPFPIVATFGNVALRQNGSISIQLPDSLNGNYYILVGHRNSIDTWSAMPVNFSGNEINYDFTNDDKKAYGKNLKLTGNAFGIFSGDADHNGIVDTGDMTLIDNDASGYASGYLATDLNGDGIVDTGDITIVDNNSSNYIGVILPDVQDLSSVLTAGLSNIKQTTANGGGQVFCSGGTSTAARGVCWSTLPHPTTSDIHTTDGSGAGIFISNLFGLTPGTHYYLRAYATNCAGTAYGEEIEFTTALVTAGYGTTDIDSTFYSSIILGSQEWMAENLRTTRYANGDIIPNVTSNSEWSGMGTGGWCWYNNDSQYENPYGKLYNWFAVADSRNLCPTGWNVPSDADWTVLTNYLGGVEVADGKMKEAGFQHWYSPNNDADNSSGFTGLPGGSRNQSGTFTYLRSYGYWWSSGEKDSGTAWCRSLGFNYLEVIRIGQYKKNGISVRCVRQLSLPDPYTASVSGITETSAKGGGNILSDGGAPVDLGGICWSTSPNPTTADSHTTDGSGTGAFTSNITNLTGNNLYYVRAYATNSVGTVYGNEVSFRTLPEFECGSPLTINHSVSGGIAPVDKTVTYGTVTRFMGEPSKCWITSNLGSDHQAFAVDDATEAAAGWYWQFNRKQGYKHNGANLTPGTWVVPINENSDWLMLNDPCNQELGAGWRIPTYSEWYNVKGEGSYWTNWTNWNLAWSSELKLHAAGYLNDQNGALINRGSKGSYWSGRQSSTGNGWRLQFNEIYCNLGSDNKSTGNPVRCLRDNTGTSASLPVLTTGNISDININSASCGGNVSNDGGAAITTFGVCWSTNPVPTINNFHTTDGSGTGSFTSTLVDLSPGTVYFVRAYATNFSGTQYGNEITFTTLLFISGGGVTDIDTNVYPSKIIGTQEWISDNLYSTKFNNGDAIPEVTEDGQWSGLETGAWCWYNHNSAFENPYGKLYNWFAINDPRNICPSGWHVPTDAEWTELTEYLGGQDEAGSRMKEAGILHWNSPNSDATNSGGFTGLPGGNRISCGIFENLGNKGYWWSSDENNASDAWGRSLIYNDGATIRNSYNKVDGMSVRCLRQQILPVLSTRAISNIWGTTATGGGNISFRGETPVTSRGVCWSSSPNPTTATSHTNDGSESGAFASNLTCLIPETTYYVRAYASNSEGTQYGNEVSFMTLPDFECGSPFTINHIAGAVAPVDKTVTYNTVTNIEGESSKCWITSNLGADQQATAKDDNTEASAGWYWQFNRKQGYKHDGTARTPNTTWIDPINENLEWQPANDPCSLELGNSWRIPTYTEWLHVDASGNWNNWNGPWNSGLKLHAGGRLNEYVSSDQIYGGFLEYRGVYGRCWSSTQFSNNIGWTIDYYSGFSGMEGAMKASGFPVRCIRTPY